LSGVHVVIENVNVSELVPYDKNSRTHTDQQINQIVKSIKEFGFTNPVLVDKDNGIIAGHARVQAAKKMGMASVPCIRLSNLTSAQKRAYVIADNKLALNAGWDSDALKFEITGLKDEDFDLSLTGFDQGEIEQILIGNGNDGLTDQDAVPDVGEEPVTKTGDVWIMGDHRLICGDSTSAEDVNRLLDGGKADIVFTDPPYGVSIGSKNRFLNSFQKGGRNLTDIESDDMKPEELKDKLLVPAFTVLKSILAENATVFLTAPQGGELGMMMMLMMKEAGLPVRHVLIWKKNAPTFSMGRLDYDYQHEPILLTWGKKHEYYGAGQHRTSVWEIDKPTSSKEHPTMKPVELYVNAYLNNSKAGDIAYEPFSGSGTAFIASEKVGRKCRGIEISPHYCDVIIKRWEEFSGRKAILETVKEMASV
jgi:DNA modification methylase